MTTLSLKDRKGKNINDFIFIHLGALASSREKRYMREIA